MVSNLNVTNLAFVVCLICLVSVMPEPIDYVDYDDFREAALDEINKFRKIYQAPPLTLDDDLSYGAEDMAAKHANSYAEKGKFAKMSNSPAYGDSVHITIASVPMKQNATRIVRDWSKQKDLYDWNNISKNLNYKVGQFTQMVWKSSKSLGVGIAVAKNAKKLFMTVVVFRYSPAGNIWDVGSFQKNILPPVKKASNNSG